MLAALIGPLSELVGTWMKGKVEKTDQQRNSLERNNGKVIRYNQDRKAAYPQTRRS
jgi:hypothetical protein